VPSIINGLFSGRSGLASHGTAIAVVGDNISNTSTIGYKASRAEFEDLIAGGQTAGKVVGSGSTISAVSTIFEQGTLEFTSRPLDLAIDGNGFFVLADGAQRFYTRAGNFKIDSSGYIVNQNDLTVMGFPAGGTGALQPLNVNAVSQDSVATTGVALAGNLDASSGTIAASSIPAANVADGTLYGTDTVTYADLNEVAEFSSVVQVFDSLGAQHTVTFFFFHTGSNQFQVRGYVNSEDVDDLTSGTPNSGFPRLIYDGTTTTTGEMDMTFNGDGTRSNAPAIGTYDLVASIPWNNGSDPSSVNISFDPFTQYSGSSNILSITQDGQGVGTVVSLAIDSDGAISARLSNGQSAVVGAIGLVNFANPEGLTRIGNQLLQQSTSSGEPVVGRPLTGTFGGVESGRIELSTVDIANEFVRMITLQRGFQANSRVITTINQLLNEIIQLA
jgi:flagellar hook protein FlgE